MLKSRTKEAICDHIVKFNLRKSRKKLNAHFLLRTVQKLGDILYSELADPWVFEKFAWIFFGILEFFRAWVFLKRPKKKPGFCIEAKKPFLPISDVHRQLKSNEKCTMSKLVHDVKIKRGRRNLIPEVKIWCHNYVQPLS